MKAFVLKEKNNTVICDMPRPVLSDDYAAILSPIAISPCTSDVNTVYGNGSKKPDDLILGHECIATVVEVGSKVKDFTPGDRVCVPAITPDWSEPGIQEGNLRHAGKAFSGNALGRSKPGVFAEFFEVEDADMNLAKIPDEVSDEAALMVVDMAATGFTGAEAAEIKFGDTVVVMGIGAVGLMAIAASALSGAGKIIAVGSRPASTVLAIEYGASEVVDYKKTDIVNYVLEETNGKGADAVIICGGADDAMAKAVEMTKYGTGIIVNLKLFAGDGDISFPKFASGRGMGGKTIKMELCKGGRAWMERLLKLVSEERFDPGLLVTKKFEGFENIADALEMMKNKGDDIIKIMVVPEWTEQ